MSSTPRLGAALYTGRIVFETAEEQASYFDTFEIRRLPVPGLVDRAMHYGYDDDGRRTIIFLDRVRTSPVLAWNFVESLAVS